jgi:dTDP-glucose 4,6-dehydratase
VRLLITGGAGFIGSNFIRHIINKYPDYEIINLDKLTYCGNLANLKDLEKNKRYKFAKGDIGDKRTVEKLVGKVDVVVNFAAQTHVDRSIKDAGDFVKTNVYGTYILAEAVKKYNLKLVHISTDEVYGSVKQGSFKETDNLKPSSPYSATKAAGDLLVLSYWTTFKVPVVITRSSNNFGPYQYPEKVIPLFITNAIHNMEVPLYGDGQNVRDWLYVLDNCEAIDEVLHKGRLGEVYNIGGGYELPNIELTKMILKHLGKTEKLIKPVTDRLGHDRRYSLNCEKIRSELGWKPRHNFESALMTTINWYKDNEQWWGKLKR